FDVAGVVRQLREVRAGYFVLTLGQNSGHYCVPNETYDRLTGIRPSKCARRDLVSELHEALAPHNIRLMVYLPAGAPEYAAEAVRKLEWSKGTRCAAFQRKWEAIIREWSLRWGKKVSGWWFDGCYYNDEMYRHAEEPNFRSFAAAIRAGNPDSIIGWNPGVVYPPYTVDKEEDYTAGEVNDPRAFDPPGRWVQHAQFHMLTYLGKTWGQLPLRFTDDEAIAHTLAFTRHGGVVTWDTPLTYEGHIDAGAFAILKEVGKAVDATRGQPDLPAPKVVRPSVTFAEIPMAGDGAGLARMAVTLRNNQQERLQGQVSFSLEPCLAGRVLGDGVMPYDLQPGDCARQDVRLQLNQRVSPDSTPVRVLISRTGTDRTLRYPLPKRERIRLPRLAQLPALENVGSAMAQVPARAVITEQGRMLGEIKLGVAEGCLVMHCQVTDAIMRQTSNIWDGSCMEVFGVAEPGDVIKQLWLLPAMAAAPAKSLELDRSAKHSPASPANEIQLASWKSAVGYTSAAIIPLAWWLKREQAPSRFMLEIVICAGIDERMFARTSLFKSADPANCTDEYALVEIDVSGG
ncbi:MAG: hypothetical protein PHR35_04775, partial [Kiritimatiellae bacterium]|nr:hypothetical protein [Kiritimatiellia bacterium]